jgi:hypothetical protein
LRYGLLQHIPIWAKKTAPFIIFRFDKRPKNFLKRASQAAQPFGTIGFVDQKQTAFQPEGAYDSQI